MSEMTVLNGVSHAYDFRQSTNPMQAFTDLYEALAPFGDAFTLKTSATLPLINEQGTAIILLVSTGCFSICHEHNGLHMATVCAPSIGGLASLDINYPGGLRQYIYAETPCAGWILPLPLFIEKCNQNNLWRPLSLILTHRMILMSFIDRELIGNDVYSKVRSLLIEVWHYPEAIRSKIKIASFIQRRTHISRSRIMEIFAGLKGIYAIEINAGVLMNLDEPLLPAKIT